MTTPTTAVTPPATTPFAPVTAPPGTGFVTIPGGTPGVSTAPAGRPAVPGPQNDGSDFYGLAIAVVLIVGAILLVRRLVPLQRGGSRPAERPRPAAGVAGLPPVPSPPSPVAPPPDAAPPPAPAAPPPAPASPPPPPPAAPPPAPAASPPPPPAGAGPAGGSDAGR